MTRVSLACLFLCLLPGTFAAAQDPSGSGIVSTGILDPGLGDLSQNVSGATSLGNNGSYLIFTHTVGDQIGSPGGYTNFGMFAPIYMFESDTLFYSDIQGLITETKKMGFNAGVGVRHYATTLGGVVGGNFYYTSDDAKSGANYEQLGVGVEWLSDRFDVYANGYFPLNDEDSNPLQTLTTGTTPVFKNGSFFFQNTRLAQQAVSGGDLELGVPIANLHWLKGYAGTYYYDTKQPGTDGLGVRGRMVATLSTDTAVQVSVTDDDQFGTNWNLAVSLAFSGGRTAMLPRRSMRERLFEQTHRQDRIAVTEFVEQFDTPFINPSTGLPFGPGSIVFVQNNAAPGGDGTFENPFQQVLGALPDAQIIVVLRGDSSFGNPLISNFELTNGQQLLGEGVPHTFAGGAIVFPGLATSGGLPWVTTGTGNVVELADNNIVDGLNIISPAGGNAIFGSNIKNFTITNINNDVTPGMTTGPGGGIVLQNATGTGLIADARFNSSTTSSPGGVTVLNSGTGTLNLVMDTLAFVNGGMVGLGLEARNGAVINADVEGFNADNNGTGLRLAASNGGALDVIIDQSTFTNANGLSGTAGHGVSLLGNGGRFNVSVTDTPAGGAAANGLNISMVNSQFTAKFEGGDFTGAGQDAAKSVGNGVSIVLNNTNTGFNGTSPATLSLSGESAMDQLSFDNARQDGFIASLTNNSNLFVTINNGSFNGAGQDAFDVLVSGDSTLNLMVDPTPAMGAAAHGLNFNVVGGSLFNASFLDGDFSNAMLNGVRGTVSGAGSQASLQFDNTPITGAGQSGTGDAFNVLLDNGAALSAVFTNSQSVLGQNGSLSDAANNGIVATLTNGSVAAISLDATPVVGSGIRGGSGGAFDFDVSGGSALSFAFSNASASDSLDFGLITQADGAGTSATLAFTNAVINNSGVNSANPLANGIDLDATNGAQIFADFVGGSINNSRNNGVEIDLTSPVAGSPGSNAVLTFNNTSITGSGTDAFNFNVQNAGNLTASFIGGSLSNSGDNFIDGTVINPGSVATLSLDGTTMDNSGGQGLLFNVTDGGVLNFDLGDSTVTNTGGPGLDMTFVGGTHDLQFTNATLSGVEFNLSMGAMLSADFTGGSLSGGQADGLNLLLNNSSADFTFLNTQIDNNGLGGAGDGVNAVAMNQSSLSLDFTGGSIDTNSDNGLDLDAIGAGSSIDLSMNGTSASSNINGDGLHFEVTGGASLSSSNGIANAMLNGNSDNGVDGLVRDLGSIADLNFDRTHVDANEAEGVLLNIDNMGQLLYDSIGVENGEGTIAGSGEFGLLANITGAGSSAAFSFNNTDITNSGRLLTGNGDGMRLNVTGAAAGTASFTASAISASDNSGLTANLDAGSTLDVSILNSDIQNNQEFGIQNIVDGAAATLDYEITETRIDGSGISGLGNGDGIRTTVTNGAAFTAAITTGSISGSNNTGVNTIVDGAGSTAELDFNQAVVNLSGLISGQGDGVGATVTGGGALDMNFIAGSVSSHRDNGVVVNVDGAGSIADVNFDVDNVFAGTQVNGNRNGSGLDFVASNGATLNLNASGTSFSGNGVEASGNGVIGSVRDAGTTANVTFSSTTASNNIGDLFTPTGNGFFLTVEDGAALTSRIINSSRAESNSNSGVRVDARDAGTVAIIDMTGSNVFSNNGAVADINGDVSNRDGVDINASNIAQLDVSLSGTISGNGGAGADIAIDTVAMVSDLTVDALTVTDNGGNGVRIDVDNTAINNGTVTNNFIQNNNTRGNVGAGLQIDLFNSPAPAFVVADNTQIDGVSFALNTSDMMDLVIDNNIITGNSTGDGIAFDVTDSNIRGAIVDNTISGNDGNGIGFRPTATPAFVAANAGPLVLDFRSDVNHRLTGETISGIGDGGDLMDNAGNLITNSTGGAGIFANLGVDTRLIADVSANTITNSSSFGIGVRAENGTFDLNVGGDAVDALTGDFIEGNVINNNVGAGISVLALNASGFDTVNAPNTFNIRNNVITNTRDDANANNAYLGDGIHVQLTTTNVLVDPTGKINNPRIHGNFIGVTDNGAAAANMGRGISVNLQGDTEISDFDITSNNISRNRGTGIQFLRLDDAVLSDLLNVNVDPNVGPLSRAVTITDNTINNNGQGLPTDAPLTANVPEFIEVHGDGIDLVMRNGELTLNSFEVDRNTIQNNARAVHMEVGADARLLVDLEANLLTNSTGRTYTAAPDVEGTAIHLTEEQNNPEDRRVISGTWIKNTIANNAGHGVHVQSVTGGLNPLAIGLNGTDPLDGRNRGNLITDNALDGIQLGDSSDTSQGIINIPESIQTASTWIINNQIARNGTGGVDINSDRMNRITNMTNNVVVDNRGDGVEIFTGNVLADNHLTMLGNSIVANDGRGVDILARDRSDLAVKIGDGTADGANRIDQNLEEGIYVVNTPAPGQDQGESETLLADDFNRIAATLDTRPIGNAGQSNIVLDIDNNTIRQNGKNSAIDGSGLVIRVGTQVGVFDPFGDGEGFGTEAGTFGNGRVNARVVNNSFEGNFGVDTMIESFRATIDPPATTGTWDDMMFSVMGSFRRDPLARLNLVFSGNDGNSLGVTRIGAFYNNDEADWKSRVGGRTAPAPNGPFTPGNGDRRRNAQRIPARHEDINFNGVLDPGEDTNGNGIIDFMQPTVNTADIGPNGYGEFLYDGIGRSTFRIAAGFDIIDGIPGDGQDFTSGDGFLVDTGPIPDFSAGNGGLTPAFLNARGIIRGGVDEMPYGWGTWVPDLMGPSFPAPATDVAPFMPSP